MIQIITPGSFIKNSHLLKDCYIRLSPKRGEITLSPGLLDKLAIQAKGRTRICFALDSKLNEIFIGHSKHLHDGFNVSFSQGKGRVYSVSMFKLLERAIHRPITEPISISVETIPRIFNDQPLLKLFLSGLKQEETVPDEDLIITEYKRKPYTRKRLLALIRAYWERSESSMRKVTRERNFTKYQALKKHCEERELDIDFAAIENEPS